MNETVLESLIVRLRADTAQFRSDIAGSAEALKGLETTGKGVADKLTNVWTDGAFAAGFRGVVGEMESALDRFVRTGKLSFGDLRSTALSVISEISAAWIGAMAQQDGYGASSGQSSGSGGFFASLFNIAMSAYGSSGRATGGPVQAGSPYLVGEQGPELFIPDRGGTVMPAHETAIAGVQRPISITINLSGGSAEPQAMRESAGQLAATLRRALGAAGRNL